MSVQDIRDHVTAARELIASGDTAGAQRHLDLAAQQLDPGTPPLTEGLWTRLAPLLPSHCGKARSGTRQQSLHP